MEEAKSWSQGDQESRPVLSCDQCDLGYVIGNCCALVLQLLNGDTNIDLAE